VVSVGTPGRFVALAGGGDAGYALDDEGAVWAWGSNYYGQLGNGTTTRSLLPVRVKAATGTLPVFTAIAGGEAAGYALDKDGGIWAWGDNENGQLGDGTVTPSSTPVRVRAASGALPVFTAIAGGYTSVYALDKDGGIWAWGSNNGGQLGNGTTQGSPIPVRVQAGTEPLPVFTAIAAKSATGYALDKDGGIWAWGDNYFYQLGNNSTTLRSANPVRVQAGSEPLPVFTAIAASYANGYGLDKDGGIWAWGHNQNGELGNGTTTSSRTPVRVQAASGLLPVFTAIAAGSSSGYGLDMGGSIWAWGPGSSGQLGNGTTAEALNPVRVTAASGALPPFTTIAIGSNTAHAQDEDGVRWAWGWNSSGQLGNGTTGLSARPVRVPVVVGSVTFGGTPGTNPTFSNGQWSVKTPQECGRLPVEVSFGFGSGTGETANAGTFDFGRAPAITVQPVSGTVISGQTFTTKVGVSGDPTPTVQWQSRATGSWVDVPGATGVTLSVQPTVSTEYRAVVSSCWSSYRKGGLPVTSARVSVTVQPSSPSTSGSSSATASLPSGSQSPNAGKASAVGLAMKQVTMKTKTSLKAVSLVYPLGVKAKLTWSSSKPKVAKVNASGKIQALKPGRTVITATAEGGKTARLKVTVVNNTVKLKTLKAAKTATVKLKKGKTKRLSVAPTPASATLTKMPTFKSSKPKVATVDKTGLITAKKKGKTKLTVTLAGKKTTLVVSVA